MRLVIDLEADGLLYDAQRIWCIVAYDLDSDHYFIYADGSIPGDIECTVVSLQEFTMMLLNADELILHNGLGYDLPLIEKLLGIDTYALTSNVFDTFTGSCLLFPDREGGHSLKAWGDRLGYGKGDHDDWTRYSEDMLRYCIRDVNVTRRVYSELQREMEEITTA